MRAIEKRIIDYVKNSDFLSDSAYCGKSKDLSTRDSVTLEKNTKRVYLHGNCIFTLDKENNVRFSFQGWRTDTTKSRINTLLSAFSSCSAVIYQKNYHLVFSSSAGKFPIGSGEIYTIRNGKPEKVESI